LKEVSYKVSVGENCQQQNYKAFVVLSIHAKMMGGGRRFYVKIWRILTHPLQNTEFQFIFARSASVVRPNTNRKCTTRIIMSLTWTSHQPAQRGLKNAKRPFYV